MLKPEQIPYEVVEAAARAAYEIAHKIDCNSDPDQWVDAVNEYREHWRQQVRAAIVAALNAWPEVTTTSWFENSVRKAVLNVPLPQETRDE